MDDALDGKLAVGGGPHSDENKLNDPWSQSGLVEPIGQNADRRPISERIVRSPAVLTGSMAKLAPMRRSLNIDMRP